CFSRASLVPLCECKHRNYNSDGTFAGDIPLARQMPKGAVRVDTKRQRITAVSICFDGSKRLFEFHFYSLKEDFRRDLRELMRERCGHRDR
ncbi:hypothetical protein, partial [Paramuribaculum intestinale]|uniref:hypothetical protein n=1 Tax=Paramuribaculum intestinale TaxID=2094151 RepID=UPI0025B5BB64